MKVLHTSDWHLGRALYGRKRYDEFDHFLAWLAQTIEAETVDLLLVAGDVFDTATPSNRAQELYYRFLCRVAGSCCRHVVVIAGNHDSPTFLNAPKELLRALDVHVVGAMGSDPVDEVIVLGDRDRPEAIVCAVPYLRDRDLRTATPGETIDDKNAKLVEGLRDHYQAVCEEAERQRTALVEAGHPQVPLIAMGHLFTAGGRTVDGDGVRELYVGSLVYVEREVFPPVIDYLALGHLHVPQAVAGLDHYRYSGSPLPMGFGEASQQKQVVLIEFAGITPKVATIPVPCFQRLVRIGGTIEEILARLAVLQEEGSNAWLEIEYTGRDLVGDLREQLEDGLAGSAMEIRRIKNRRVIDRLIGGGGEEENLDDLDVGEVFRRRLDSAEIMGEERELLTTAYNEIITTLHEEDHNAE